MTELNRVPTPTGPGVILSARVIFGLYLGSFDSSATKSKTSSIGRSIVMSPSTRTISNLHSNLRPTSVEDSWKRQCGHDHDHAEAEPDAAFLNHALWPAVPKGSKCDDRDESAKHRQRHPEPRHNRRNGDGQRGCHDRGPSHYVGNRNQ